MITNIHIYTHTYNTYIHVYRASCTTSWWRHSASREPLDPSLSVTSIPLTRRTTAGPSSFWVYMRQTEFTCSNAGTCRRRESNPRGKSGVLLSEEGIEPSWRCSCTRCKWTFLLFERFVRESNSRGMPSCRWQTVTSWWQLKISYYIGTSVCLSIVQVWPFSALRFEDILFLSQKEYFEGVLCPRQCVIVYGHISIMDVQCMYVLYINVRSWTCVCKDDWDDIFACFVAFILLISIQRCMGSGINICIRTLESMYVFTCKRIHYMHVCACVECVCVCVFVRACMRV